MKAEQRKELETNTLADRMGHMMQRVKGGTRRTFVTYLLVLAAILVAVWFGYNWYRTDVTERSLRWVKFYDGAGGELIALATEKETKDTPAGKAARFQIAWHLYWDDGVKMVGVNPAGAMTRLREVRQFYDELLSECKDDPIFEPQAMLGQAVVTESLAAQDISYLDKAKELYKTLAEHEKYKTTAEGRFAQDRLKIIENKEEGAALRETYRDLKLLLSIPAMEERKIKGKQQQLLP
jgi:hypothetical protein